MSSLYIDYLLSCIQEQKITDEILWNAILIVYHNRKMSKKERHYAVFECIQDERNLLLSIKDNEKDTIKSVLTDYLKFMIGENSEEKKESYWNESNSYLNNSYHLRRLNKIVLSPDGINKIVTANHDITLFNLNSCYTWKENFNSNPENKNNIIKYVSEMKEKDQSDLIEHILINPKVIIPKDLSISDWNKVHLCNIDRSFICNPEVYKGKLLKYYLLNFNSGELTEYIKYLKENHLKIFSEETYDHVVDLAIKKINSNTFASPLSNKMILSYLK